MYHRRALTILGLVGMFAVGLAIGLWMVGDGGENRSYKSNTTYTAGENKERNIKQEIGTPPTAESSQLTAVPTPVSGVLVTRVIDGDTIELETGQTVRYIGVDTPETVHPDKGVECFGREAAAANRGLVEGQRVTLEKDVSETDQYGRLLRYVYVGDEMVNDYLVRNGFANASTWPPDIKYQGRFQAAEQYARDNQIGLWAPDACTDDSNASGEKFPTVPSPTGACLVKGNISFTSGDKIYHVPGCPYYDQTSINVGKGEKYFCTEQEAADAGWRKAQNCP